MPAPSGNSEVGVLKLLGEHFSFVIPQNHTQPPSLILGRKLSNQASDVFPIAADRNISRQHARLFWDPTTAHWMVECLGKNGMHVDDRFVDGNGRVVLDWGANGADADGGGGLFIKMQIGDVVFFVMQPVQANRSSSGNGQRSAR